MPSDGAIHKADEVMSSLDRIRRSEEGKRQYAVTYAAAKLRMARGEPLGRIWKALYRRPAPVEYASAKEQRGYATSLGLSSMRADALNDVFEGRPPTYSMDSLRLGEQMTDTPPKPKRKPAAKRKSAAKRWAMDVKRLLAESIRMFAFLKERGFTAEAPSEGWAGVIWALHYLHPQVELTVELDCRDGFAGVSLKRRHSPLRGSYLQALLPRKFPKPPRRSGNDRYATSDALLETLEQDARVLDAHLDAAIAEVVKHGPPPIAHLVPSKDDDESYRKHAAKFAASYMSDTKWRKAFTLLNEHRQPGMTAKWKFIDDDRVFSWGLPRKGDLLAARLRDGTFQPVQYRWIEWIRIPATTSIGEPLNTELEAVRNVLEKAGQFRLTLDESGLTLFGYGT